MVTCCYFNLELYEKVFDKDEWFLMVIHPVFALMLNVIYCRKTHTVVINLLQSCCRKWVGVSKPSAA